MVRDFDQSDHPNLWIINLKFDLLENWSQITYVDIVIPFVLQERLNIEDNTTTIQRNQSAHTAKAEPILELMWSKRLLFGHFRTKNKFASQNRLVRLPHLLIQSEKKSPVQNTIYGSRFFSFIQELYA